MLTRNQLDHLKTMRDHRLPGAIKSWCVPCGKRSYFTPVGLSMAETHLKYKCVDCGNSIYTYVKNDYQPILF